MNILQFQSQNRFYYDIAGGLNITPKNVKNTLVFLQGSLHEKIRDILLIYFSFKDVTNNFNINNFPGYDCIDIGVIDNNESNTITPINVNQNSISHLFIMNLNNEDILNNYRQNWKYLHTRFYSDDSSKNEEFIQIARIIKYLSLWDVHFGSQLNYIGLTYIPGYNQHLSIYKEYIMKYIEQHLFSRWIFGKIDIRIWIDWKNKGQLGNIFIWKVFKSKFVDFFCKSANVSFLNEDLEDLNAISIKINSVKTETDNYIRKNDDFMWEEFIRKYFLTPGLDGIQIDLTFFNPAIINSYLDNSSQLSLNDTKNRIELCFLISCALIRLFEYQKDVINKKDYKSEIENIGCEIINSIDELIKKIEKLNQEKDNLYKKLKFFPQIRNYLIKNFSDYEDKLSKLKEESKITLSSINEKLMELINLKAEMCLQKKLNNFLSPPVNNNTFNILPHLNTYEDINILSKIERVSSIIAKLITFNDMLNKRDQEYTEQISLLSGFFKSNYGYVMKNEKFSYPDVLVFDQISIENIWRESGGDKLWRACINTWLKDENVTFREHQADFDQQYNKSFLPYLEKDVLFDSLKSNSEETVKKARNNALLSSENFINMQKKLTFKKIDLSQNRNIQFSDKRAIITIFDINNGNAKLFLTDNIVSNLNNFINDNFNLPTELYDLKDEEDVYFIIEGGIN